MGNSSRKAPWRLLADWMSGQGRPRRDLVREMEELSEEGTAEGVINEGEEEMLRLELLVAARPRQVLGRGHCLACLDRELVEADRHDTPQQIQPLRLRGVR